MRCPSCGEEIAKVSILGFDDSLRCQKCGGVWAANWVVNNLATGKEMRIEPLLTKTETNEGKSTCPQDGTLLMTPAREAVPEDMVILRCDLCGGWWFPGDEIFKFKQAFRDKQAYLRSWRKVNWLTYAWPALVLALMVAGVGGGVWLVREQQRIISQASYGVKDFVVIDYGQGKVEMRFGAGEAVGEIEYRQTQAYAWHTAKAYETEGGYKVTLPRLTPGVEYVVRIGSDQFKFKVK